MIKELNIVSEDQRRVLAEFGEGGTWKIAKYLSIKEDSVIGDHYHLNKDECFLLLKGSAKVIIGKLEVDVKAPVVIQVNRNTYHSFNIKKGSILICLASEEHDSNDDHKTYISN